MDGLGGGMAVLAIELLGSFRVRLGGENITAKFRTDKERALFAYLAFETVQVHRRESLAELFWPDKPEGAARTNLRQAFYGLRKTLGPMEEQTHFLLSTGDSVQFNPKAGLWLDIREYQQLLAKTQTHRHQSLDTCLVCTQHLQAATSLYRGDFFADIFTPDSQAFSEWVLFRREQYARQQLATLQSLSEYYRRMGDLDQVYQYASQQVSLAPMEEQGYRELMVLLATTGRRNAALEQYQTLKRILADGLGVEPAVETREIYEKIRSGIKLDGQMPRIENRSMHNFPVDLTQFYGRQRELEWFDNCMTNRVCRLTSVVGMAGSGKTRLVVEAAHQYAHLFPDGVWFKSVEGLFTGDQLLRALADVFGLPLRSQEDPQSQLIQFLRPLKCLLLLDSFEGLVDQTELLLEILRQAPGLKILLTTQVRINYQSTCLLDVGGLLYPALEDGLSGVNAPAVQLFMARAQRSLGEITLTAENLRLIARVCELVGGMPLAIELAAANLSHYSLAQLIRSLESGLQVLAVNLQDIPARHRSMQVAIDHTWSLLTDNERWNLLQLADYTQRFTAAQVETERGIRQDSLNRLLNKSLLQVDEEGVYQLFPLIRLYAQAIKDEQPEQTEPRRDTGSLSTNTLLDPVTRLPNYLLFRDRLKHVLARARRHASMLSVMLVKYQVQHVDGKPVERKAADMITQIMARRLVACLRQSDTVARLGREGFGLILEDLAHPPDCAKIARKLLAAVGNQILLDDQPYQIYALVGVVIYPMGGETLDELMNSVRRATDNASRAGEPYACIGLEEWEQTAP